MSLVISHRGANREAPENTLPAYERALAYGVDGFETDVHLTRDGRLVVCHDDTVDRTSNGCGRIMDHSLEELRGLDFGAWFSPDFAGTKIPTLEEWFALCDPLKIINVELKQAPDGSTESAAAVIRMAKERRLFDRLIISSFDLEMLLACKREDPGTRVAMLYQVMSPLCGEICDDLAAFAKKYDLDAYHPLVLFIDRDYVEECHNIGLMVNPWVVNQEHGLILARDWGCDAVITDVPELAVRINHGGG
ncbi:MAG: hypothetical protein FWH26_00295 [Oscillospiraceae bacterium]|nr:hypothetical protein [Oscillospiraceae bacterium]